jgi:hypothetical protein
MAQRRQYALQLKGKKSSFNAADGPNRIQQLEAIGFVWKVERRGPRGAYGSLRMMKHRAGNRSGGDNDIVDVVDYEKYIIEKIERSEMSNSDDEIREAWRQRFDIFQ